MSRNAKAFLVGSTLVSGLTVWGVHFMQIKERETMYKGVERDEARQAAKKAQRQREADLLANQEREAQFQQMQPTRNYSQASTTIAAHSVIEEGKGFVDNLVHKAQSGVGAAGGAVGGREAEDRAYITGRWAMNGLQVGAVAATPLYLINSLRKGTFTFKRLVRANWTTPLLSSVGGAVAGAGYSATLPAARSSSTSAQYRQDAAAVRRDDVYLIGGVLGALLTPAILLRPAGLINGVLGGGLGLGGAGGMIWDAARGGVKDVVGKDAEKEVEQAAGSVLGKVKALGKEAQGAVEGK